MKSSEARSKQEDPRLDWAIQTLYNFPLMSNKPALVPVETWDGVRIVN